MRWLGLFSFVLLGLVCGLQAQRHESVVNIDHGPNAPSQISKHYVVLVSLDGFRYDYAKKYGATHLLALAAKGASAPGGMIPSYPSLSSPNLYTLVTGLYPEHHGIVGNRFWDPQRRQEFSYSNPSNANDGTWYGGTPLWSLAEKQGMRTACLFWPGSEAKIAGERPSSYLSGSDRDPGEKRIEQVIAWLKLPPAKRPHLITLSYPDVDRAGHQFGPDSPQTAAAVKHVDVLIGMLETDLENLGLPVNLIVVSDHGMAAIQGGWINLDQYISLADVKSVGVALYPSSEAAADHIYQRLKAADAAFMVYRRTNVPAELHFNSNPRAGDPVIVAQGPFAIRAAAPAAGSEDEPPAAGDHGFNPWPVPEMKAIFYAEGPDIRRGVLLQPFQNVNVYPLIVRLLGLKSGPVDGSVNVLAGIVRSE